MKLGDLVKFKTPLSDEDPNEVYILREDICGTDSQGEYKLTRVDVSPMSCMDWPIPPVQRVNVEDIVCVS